MHHYRHYVQEVNDPLMKKNEIPAVTTMQLHRKICSVYFRHFIFSCTPMPLIKLLIHDEYAWDWQFSQIGSDSLAFWGLTYKNSSCIATLHNIFAFIVVIHHRFSSVWPLPYGHFMHTIIIWLCCFWSVGDYWREIDWFGVLPLLPRTSQCTYRCS